MDFDFPEDTLMLRDMLRRFVQKEARPLEMDFFNLGSLKPEQQAKLRRSIDQLGLWGLMAPEIFGGGGLDVVTSCLIEEELGGTFIPLEIGNIPPMLYACQGDQVSRFLEPALEGSRRPIIAAREPGPSGLRPEDWMTTVIQDGEEFIVNGKKVLTLSPNPDDFFIVYAKNLSENGNIYQQSVFLVEQDTPGVKVSSDGENTLHFQDCRLGKDNLLGEFGRGLRLAVDEAPRIWIQTGARYVGLAERLLEMASEHARDWVSLGAALAVRPAIQRMLAEMRVEIDCVRWLVYHAAWLVDTGKTEQIRLAAAQVRIASIELLKHSIDRTTMAFAGPGPSPQIEPQRIIGSLVPMEVLELALENARAVVAHQVLNLSQS